MTQEATCLDKITDVIEQINYAGIPAETVQKAKECLADFIAVLVKGSENKMSHDLKEAMASHKVQDKESLALWMGSTARMPDTDDGHRFAMAHPGVAINSAAIAMCVSLPKINGKDLLEAIVKGYELYCYQGRVINPSAYLKRGIDATGVCGGPAAAVVAGSLTNADRAQLENGISLAASLAGGLNQSAIDGSAQKYIVAGWAAKLGIAAAEMAHYNLGGPSHVYEGKLGYCNAFTPEPNEEVLHHPRLCWDINSVYMKQYACVRRIHATLDAIGDIVHNENLTVADIKKINVYGSQFLFDAGRYDPIDGAQAQTSVPYAVSIFLNFGEVEDQLVHANLQNKEIAVYSRKIVVEKDPEIMALAEKDKSLWGAAKVRVETEDGRVFTGKQISPYGDPEQPLPEKAVENKFISFVGEYLGQKYAEELWQAIINIDNEADCGAVFKKLLKQF